MKSTSSIKVQVKLKVRPRRGHYGPEGGIDVQLYSFFHLDARWGGSLTPRPGRFISRERDPAPIV